MDNFYQQFNNYPFTAIYLQTINHIKIKRIMKKLFALCMITFALIVFAPPGQSNSPPIQDDFGYCIPSATFAPDMVAIELQMSDYSFSQIEMGKSEFAEVNEINVSHNYGLLCGYSRNAVSINEGNFICNKYDNFEPDSGNLTYVHNQPRDGLTEAAA